MFLDCFFSPLASGEPVMKKLWLDEGGAILSVEMILIMVIVVIGLVVGLTALRDAIDSKLAELGAAVGAIDPGYGWSGLYYEAIAADIPADASAWVAGSAYNASLPGEVESEALEPYEIFTATLAAPGVAPDNQSVVPY
jgi:Flp pilus assembly pilin Flp